MNSVVAFFNANPIIALFLIVGSGMAIGNIRILGFSFGSTGVIFTGILFGHFGVTIPEDIKTLGVILFVYSIGLQAGPRFFRMIHRNGFTYLLIALVSLFCSALTAWTFVKVFGLQKELGVGLFAGSLTSTPGLAAALDIKRDPTISIGYGIAYPFGIIGVLLFVQLLASMKRTRNELQEEKEIRLRSEFEVHTKQFVVTNPNCTGKSLIEIDIHSMTQANITHIRRGDQIFMAHGDLQLRLNDVIRAAGTNAELKKLEHLIGSETHADLAESKTIVTRDIYISSRHIAGKSISQLEIHTMYGVVLTRMVRDDMEYVPTGNTILEVGDLVRAVGDIDDCNYFAQIFGQEERRIHETNLLPLAIGIVLGAILGIYNFTLPGGMKFHLGMAGGPLLVALLVSHFGRIGKLRTRIPFAAKLLTREIGLVFFLAAAGTNAGGSFVNVFQETGLKLIGFAIVTNMIPMFVAYLFSIYIFRLGYLATIGVVCGGMTMTPALAIVSEKFDSETPTLAYAAIYPIALVLITVFSQILAIILI